MAEKQIYIKKMEDHVSLEYVRGNREKAAKKEYWEQEVEGSGSVK